MMLGGYAADHARRDSNAPRLGKPAPSVARSYSAVTSSLSPPAQWKAKPHRSGAHDVSPGLARCVLRQ